MEHEKLTLKMIRGDSRWGPALRRQKTEEGRNYVMDRAQEEWDSLHLKSDHIPCHIISLHGCYRIS